MKSSQPLTIAVAAATLVGAIGFAYAQTTPDTTTPTNPSMQTQPGMMNNPSTTGSTPMTTDTGTTPMTERAPQADRN